MLNLFTLIALILLVPVLLAIVAAILKTTIGALAVVILAFLKGLLLPFTYLKKHKWIWFIQIPLLLFFLLFVYFGGLEAFFICIVLNTLIYLVIHSINRATL